MQMQMLKQINLMRWVIFNGERKTTEICSKEMICRIDLKKSPSNIYVKKEGLVKKERKGKHIAIVFQWSCQ